MTNNIFEEMHKNLIDAVRNTKRSLKDTLDIRIYEWTVSESKKELSKAEVKRKIQLLLHNLYEAERTLLHSWELAKDEISAYHKYSGYTDAIKDTKVKEIFAHIREEEYHHFHELLDVIKYNILKMLDKDL